MDRLDDVEGCADAPLPDTAASHSAAEGSDVRGHASVFSAAGDRGGDAESAARGNRVPNHADVDGSPAERGKGAGGRAQPKPRERRGAADTPNLTETPPDAPPDAPPEEPLTVTGSDLSHGGGVRLGTLVTIRWFSVIGQFICVVVVAFGLGFSVNLALCMPLMATAFALNLWFSATIDQNQRLNDRGAALHLGYDLFHLGGLLFVTGGLMNPFAVLVMGPSCVSASILAPRATQVLMALSLVTTTALAFSPFPVPWDGPPPVLGSVHTFAVWTAICLTTVFLGLYMMRIGREGRYRARALAATQLALEREQKLAALGSMAAAAAHELGTPLGTIMLVARERLSQLRANSRDEDLKTDLELIVSETDRSRALLAELSQMQSRGGSDDHFAIQPLAALAREAAGPHEGRGIPIRYVIGDGCQEPQPVLKKSPELIHGLRNLVENAVGYARNTVNVVLSWDRGRVSIRVEDDGPGFDPQIVRRLGEPYITTRVWRPGRDGGLGLGVFIAKILLERTGGEMRFGRSKAGGAAVHIRWDRPLVDMSMADRPNGGETAGS